MSGLYFGRSTLLKSFLLLGVAVISVVFIWYTFSVIDVLKKDTRSQVELYVKLWQHVANSETAGSELQVIFDEIILKATFPIVVCGSDRQPIAWRNIPGIEPDDTTPETIKQIQSVVSKMKETNGEFPLYVADEMVNYFYYGDSNVIYKLQLMPFIEIGIVVAFFIVGIVGFQNIKRSEERLIWVGMAKETAHQLGTPISSLMGWLEVIGPGHRGNLSHGESEKLIDQTAENMSVDVTRLEQVANRFGQIGSQPELKENDLNVLIQDAVVYFRRRLPFQGKGIKIDFNPGTIPPIKANPELFGWAFENLIKNALQSVDSKTGIINITTTVIEDGRFASIELSDNGKGIPVAAARRIFRPGFTTKKRGWGMGLTLVKRIIEEYHGGRIELKRSRPGETIFEIALPLGEIE